MEFCPGGELFSLLSKGRSFQDDTARFYAGCVLEALSFLHSRHIVFRDLKVCVSSDYFALCDDCHIIAWLLVQNSADQDRILKLFQENSLLNNEREFSTVFNRNLRRRIFKEKFL